MDAQAQILDDYPQQANFQKYEGYSTMISEPYMISKYVTGECTKILTEIMYGPENPKCFKLGQSMHCPGSCARVATVPSGCSCERITPCPNPETSVSNIIEKDINRKCRIDHTLATFSSKHSIHKNTYFLN